MTDVNRDRLVEIFGRVIQAPPDQRAAIIVEECGTDDRARAEIEVLVDHDACLAGFGFLEPPPLPESGVPEMIGPYRVFGLIGEGAMGSVFRAEQDKPRRPVAVKVLHPYAVTPKSTRRFEFESEVLGRLVHPGIARIYEAGTTAANTGSRPYFAMELIDGQPITRYADDVRLNLRSRLELMAKVCVAVHYAHRNGVIHRDLKPSNVLVDAAGEPHVLDFGVARIVEDARSASDRTHPGTVVGTLPYMSPEQAEGDPARVDARSDVYSLGVILYELLAGRRPFELPEGSLLAQARGIVETVPARLGTIDRALGGDPEWIVAKALAKSPDDRYSSADALAADIQRHLAHEPIEARPPSSFDRMRRFARRHRVMVTAAAAVFVVLVGSVIVLAAQAHRLRLAEAESRAQAGSALEVVSIMADAFKPAEGDQARGRPFTVRQALDLASTTLDDRAANLTPSVERDCRRIIGQTCWRLQLHGVAERHLRRALELADERGRPMSQERAELINLLANVLRDQEAFDEAEPLFGEVVAFCRANESDPAELAIVLGNHGLCLIDDDQPGRAALLLEEALELYRPINPAQAAQTAANLSTALRNLGRFDEAEARALEGLQIARGLEESDPMVPLLPLRALVWLERKRGDLTRAAAYAREQLDHVVAKVGPDNPEVGIALVNVAEVQADAGDRAPAEANFRQAVAILRTHMRSSPADLLRAIDGLRALLDGDPAAADEVRRLSEEADELRRLTGLSRE